MGNIGKVKAHQQCKNTFVSSEACAIKEWHDDLNQNTGGSSRSVTPVKTQVQYQYLHHSWHAASKIVYGCDSNNQRRATGILGLDSSQLLEWGKWCPIFTPWIPSEPRAGNAVPGVRHGFNLYFPCARLAVNTWGLVSSRAASQEMPRSCSAPVSW